MKRLIPHLLILALLLALLSGCGVVDSQEVMDLAGEVLQDALTQAGEPSAAVLETEAPSAAPTIAPTAAPTPEASSKPTAAPTPEPTTEPTPEPTPERTSTPLPEDGSYTTKEDVALYIHLYGHLPDNFITKTEARKLGWEGGSLESYAPGKCIGGDRFGNYEGLLPDKKGRTWTECDIDTLGKKSRGAKRIIFSNDGLIYYTEDHYESFELLYGEE